MPASSRSRVLHGPLFAISCPGTNRAIWVPVDELDSPWLAAKVKGSFIDPMLLLRTDSLPNDGDRWEYQLKFGRLQGNCIQNRRQTTLRSRNDNDFSLRYSDVVKGLAKLPDETVIDGEVIALDDDGRPSFNILQNYGSSSADALRNVRPCERTADVPVILRSPVSLCNPNTMRDA